MDSHAAINKRAFDIPDVGIDETLLKKLEKDFSSLEGDKLANGKILQLCSYCLVYALYMYINGTLYSTA